MNESEQDRFEAELRRAHPARVPEDFMARLISTKPRVEPARREHSRPAATIPGWWRRWRWLAPALAAAVAGLLAARGTFKRADAAKPIPAAPAFGFKADDVQVGHELVSSYDVVATLPGGQPVRFHCQKWNDQVVVTDTNRQMEIEQDTPRVKVVPVRFETY